VIEPQVLFESNQTFAIKVADDLAWRYSLTGTLPFKEDMRSQALLGLWEACTRFNPDKQALHKNNVRKQLEDSFWTVVLADAIPEESEEKADPYATFWQWAYMRVYGSIMDYLRKEGLITRIQGPDKDKKTMLYKNRFLSGDLVPMGMSLEGVDDQVTFLDLFPSKDTTDSNAHELDRKQLLKDIINSSALTEFEKKAVFSYYCSEQKVSMREVAEEANVSNTVVSSALRKALEKIKRSPVLLSYKEGKELTKYLLWWLFTRKGEDEMSPVTSVITVTTAGTPVQWLSNTSIGAGAIAVAPYPTNSGTNIYIGTKGLVASSYTNLLAQGILPLGSSWGLASPTGTSALLPSDYFFDVDNSGDKIIVTYWPI